MPNENTDQPHMLGADDLDDLDLFSDLEPELLDTGKRMPGAASAVPFRQSNNPTTATLPVEKKLTKARSSTGTNKSGGQAEIGQFFDEVQRGLPTDYVFDPATRIIGTAVKGVEICGPIRVVMIACPPDHSGFCIELEFMDRFGRIKRAAFSHADIIVGTGKYLAYLIDQDFPLFDGHEHLPRILKDWRNGRRGWRAGSAFRCPDGLRFRGPR